MVFGLILAIFVICSIFSSVFLFSCSSIAVLRFFDVFCESFFFLRCDVFFDSFLVCCFLFFSDHIGFLYLCIVWLGFFVCSYFRFSYCFFIMSMTSFSRSGYSLFLSSSSLVFISLLKFSHHSLLFRFHFSMMVFVLGRLVAIVVIIVLW